MDILEFSVQGSSETPYTISFTFDENKLSAFCTCAAGNSGTACKHRLSILAGSNSGIMGGSLEKIPKILSWLKGSEIEACLEELAAAEADLEKSKKPAATAKKKLSMAMVK